MSLDSMVEINSRHIINRGKTLGVRGDKKLEKKKRERVSLFLPPSNPLELMC